ncbi:MAG: diguanylate cyclase [Magnetococcales bacterium]|nr:diguanylate cyclase [Magnetococcales bacterium]
MATKKACILVVDDSRSARELIKSHLEQEGYAVILAGDGREAVRKFREEACDLVVMDANMPVVDGYRACAELRRQPNGREVDILMATASDDDASVEKAFAVGADEYITKPIHWVVLKKRIRLALDKRRAQEEVAEARARMEAIVNTAADAIIVINAAGIIESVNLAAVRMFGHSMAEAVGRNVSMLMPSPHREQHDGYLRAYVTTGQRRVLGMKQELVACRKDGRTFPVELTISEVKLRDRVLFTGILRDITERKEAERQIYFQANYDVLTGLANRSLFLRTLGEAIAVARRRERELALLFVDLDRFKWVNDTLGHSAGDDLLRLSADRIRESVREGDTPARLGGDEFTVILPEIDREEAIGIARRILERMNDSFPLGGGDTHISGSLGVAFFPGDAGDMNGLLKCADEAMYRSKKAGRNACHLFAGESFAMPMQY